MNFTLKNMPPHMARKAFAKALRETLPGLVARVNANIDKEEQKEVPDIGLLAQLRELLEGLNAPSSIFVMA